MSLSIEVRIVPNDSDKSYDYIVISQDISMTSVGGAYMISFIWVRC